MALDKKQKKAQAKALKKELKARAKYAKVQAEPAQKKAPKPSHAVHYAEMVRGLLFLVLSASMVAAIILQNKGVIITLDDIFDSLIAARIGKVILVLIAAAFFILGLKNLRAIK